MAAAVEYLAAEVLELSGNACKDNKKKRIIPRHICLAIRNDEELNKLFHHVTIAGGGVLPNIHQVLLPTRSKAKEGEEEGVPRERKSVAKKSVPKSAKSAKSPSKGKEKEDLKSKVELVDAEETKDSQNLGSD